jgi:hypothetical protein
MYLKDFKNTVCGAGMRVANRFLITMTNLLRNVQLPTGSLAGAIAAVIPLISIGGPVLTYTPATTAIIFVRLVA